MASDYNRPAPAINKCYHTAGLRADKTYYTKGPNNQTNAKNKRPKLHKPIKELIVKGIRPIPWLYNWAMATSTSSTIQQQIASNHSNPPRDFTNDPQIEADEEADDEAENFRDNLWGLSLFTKWHKIASTTITCSDSQYSTSSYSNSLSFPWYKDEQPNLQMVQKPTVLEISKWTKKMLSKAYKTFGINHAGFEHEIMDLILRMDEKRRAQIQNRNCSSSEKKKGKKKGIVHQVWGNRWAKWEELKASGTRGAIIVLWDKRLWRCIDSYQGRFSITCILESLHEDFRWCFTGMYGPHSNIERMEFWQELGAVRGLWGEQWVIGGNFNVCRFENERFNCTIKSGAMRNFSNIILDLELIDSPLQGAQYTWSRGEDYLQASRIDRFLISSE
ncbi:uncharacterized protein LOC142168647 [Nicotiana tabacum]|uniref:Uncharacterized protein LOC142168647 n=1 Tax=Nicotiana tabacum TaxID=4097 RepID=A0AC58SJX3_TOBAC